jgi:Ala-tRNA(Pro) deacylase
MTIAPTLQSHLDRKHIAYDLITHAPTLASMRTAEASHVPGDCLAKGVVLRRSDGYVLAILPATHRLHLNDLRRQLGEELDFASEAELDQLFPDCAHGAVPPVGECYGLDLLVEEGIGAQPEVYLEGGDHTTLVHMDRAQFARLTANAPRFQMQAYGLGTGGN